MNTRGFVELVIPEAPTPGAVDGGRSHSSGSGREMLIGALDNSKANADHLIRMIFDGLRSELPHASFVCLRKLNPSLGATAETLDRLAREANFVFAAIGD